MGTFELHDANELREAIPSAIRAGYRMIDTAQCYRNERTIGEVLADIYKDAQFEGISRKDIFLVSKLHPGCKSYEETKKRVKQTLEDLQTDYLDLFLIHWPGTSKVQSTSEQNKSLRYEKWRAIQELYREGVLKAIGVSNFTKYHLEEFEAYSKLSDGAFVMPMVNQIEIHPAWHPIEDIRWCQDHGIAVQAYSSLGRADLLQAKGDFLKKYEFLLSIAAKHHYSIPSDQSPVEQVSSLQQIFLRWAWQHGYGIIPKSRHSSRVLQNAQAINYLHLLADDMDQIDKISLPNSDSDGLLHKTCWDPRVVL